MGPWRKAALLIPSACRWVDSFRISPPVPTAAREGPRPSTKTSCTPRSSRPSVSTSARQPPGPEERALVVQELGGLDHDRGPALLEETQEERPEAVEGAPHAGQNDAGERAVVEASPQGPEGGRHLQPAVGLCEGPRLVQDVAEIRAFDDVQTSAPSLMCSVSTRYSVANSPSRPAPAACSTTSSGILMRR